MSRDPTTEREATPLPDLEDIIASLARAVQIANDRLPELVGYIAPALTMLTRSQLNISALKSNKQRTLQQMAVLEIKLVSCDPGERCAYIMDLLDLSKSTYYEYRKLLEREGVIPDESGNLGLTSEDELAG
jgi:hypothetical protein